MKKVSACNKITLVLLAFCLIAPLAATNTSEHLFLDSDNRYAEEIPSMDEFTEKIAALLGVSQMEESYSAAAASSLPEHGEKESASDIEFGEGSESKSAAVETSSEAAKTDER